MRVDVREEIGGIGSRIKRKREGAVHPGKSSAASRYLAPRQQEGPVSTGARLPIKSLLDIE